MVTFLEMGLGNAIGATLLALVASAGARLCRSAAVAHGLWLLVFVKLLTPPLFAVPVRWDVLDVTPSDPAYDRRQPVVPSPERPLDRTALAAQLRALEESPPESEAHWPGFGLAEAVFCLWFSGSFLWFG